MPLSKIVEHRVIINVPEHPMHGRVGVIMEEHDNNFYTVAFQGDERRRFGESEFVRIKQTVGYPLLALNTEPPIDPDMVERFLECLPYLAMMLDLIRQAISESDIARIREYVYNNRPMEEWLAADVDRAAKANTIPLDPAIFGHEAMRMMHAIIGDTCKVADMLPTVQQFIGGDKSGADLVADLMNDLADKRWFYNQILSVIGKTDEQVCALGLEHIRAQRVEPDPASGPAPHPMLQHLLDDEDDAPAASSPEVGRKVPDSEFFFTG